MKDKKRDDETDADGDDDDNDNDDENDDDDNRDDNSVDAFNVLYLLKISATRHASTRDSLRFGFL